MLRAALFSVAIFSAPANCAEVKATPPSTGAEDYLKEDPPEFPNEPSNHPRAGPPAEVEHKEIKPAAEAQTVAEKLAIREALDQHDAPKATRLFTRFP